MISSSVFDVLLSFLVLGLCWNKLNASKQVTLTCGSDKAIQKGSPGSPGKRGPKGSIGAPGQKGILCNNTMLIRFSKTKRMKSISLKIL